MQVECSDSAEAVWRLRMLPDEGADVAITAEGLGQLKELLERAEKAAHCRVLVLLGGDGSFCRGMDLDRLSADPGAIHEGTQLYADCLSLLRESTRFVIAAVDGDTLGGGVGLAAASDLVLATERSTFGLPELTLGLMPAMVLPVLLDRMPPQKARLLGLRALAIGASEAAQLGLVDTVVPDASTQRRQLRQLLRNALRTSPSAVNAWKSFTKRISGEPGRDGIAKGCALTQGHLSAPEVIGAIKAFGEGQPLPWWQRPRTMEPA